MFKKILKMATLMTTVSFGALAKAQEFLPGAKDIMDALIALEEISKEDCANIIQNQESNDWMQDVTPLNATLETLENNVDNPSLVSTGIDLDEETEKLIAELSREQNEKFTVSSDNPYVFEEAVPEIPESNLSELQGIIQEEKSEITDVHDMFEGAEQKMPIENMIDSNDKEEKTVSKEVSVSPDQKDDIKSSDDLKGLEVPNVQMPENISTNDVKKTELTSDEQLEADIDFLEKNSEQKISKSSTVIPALPQKKDMKEEKNDSKNFLWILALLLIAPGAFYIAERLDRKDKKDWDEKMKGEKNPSKPESQNPLRDIVITAMNLDSPKQNKGAVVQKQTMIQKEERKPSLSLNTHIKPVTININIDGTNEFNQRQKGLRMLVNNKAKRALLTKQKKALMNEYTNPDISEVRKAEIDAVLDSIAAERKKLSQERREACILYKGQKGEALREQRRLYSKKMKQLHRLMQKDGLPHLEELNEINAVRQALKEEEKRLMNEAKKEMNVRVEKMNWIHGIRSLRDVQEKQKDFDQYITLLKKEKKQKKEDILKSDFGLWVEQRGIIKDKKRALRLIKGHAFALQKNALTKQLKKALAEQNLDLAQRISEEYSNVKKQEKVFLNEAKNFDYSAKRIYMINSKTAQRIQEHRKQEKQLQDLQQQKKERLAKAQFLRGQRMLYHLAQGESTLVNGNKVTPQVYRNEALRLVGSQQRIDYPRQRASYLKKCVLADIYLNKRAKGLI